MSEFKKPTAFVDVPCEWVSATSQAEGVPANFVIEHYDDDCGASIWGVTEEKAIAAWNRRAD